MKNEWNLEDYKVVSDIKYKGIIPFIFSLFMVLGIFIILYKFNIQVFEKETLIKENNNFMLIVSSFEVSNIENNKNIYIDGKKYKYEILSISSEYANINNNIYQTLYLDIKNYQTSSKTINVYFLKSNQTLFRRIIEFMKGGKTWKN